MTTRMSGDGRNEQVDQPLATRTIVLVLVPVIAVLHLIAPDVPAGGSVGRGEPVAVGFAVLRLLSLLAAYHLLAMQLLAAVGRYVRRPRVERFALHLTPPPLRGTPTRLAGAGLAAMTTVAMPVAPAGGDPTPSTAVMRVIDVSASSTSTARITVEASSHNDPEPQADPRSASGASTASLVVEQPAPAAGHTTSEPADLAEDQQEHGSSNPAEEHEDRADASEERNEERHVVQIGDHLWAIAESVVRSGEGGEAAADPDDQVVTS